MTNRLTPERLAHLRTAAEVGIRMSGLGPHTVQVKPAELATDLDLAVLEGTHRRCCAHSHLQARRDEGASLMSAEQCRRCSECIGQDHHWIDNHRIAQEGDPYFICKHCDAACGEANEDEGIPEPSGILVRQSPICDEYLHACECEPNDGIDERGGEPECPNCGDTLHEAEPDVGIMTPGCASCGWYEGRPEEPDSSATLGLTDRNVKLR